MKNVQWRLRELLDQLAPHMNHTGYVKSEQIINDWFRNHFEIFGMRKMVSGEYASRPDFESYKDHMIEQMSAAMGVKIFEQCGVSREEDKKSKDPFRPAFGPGYHNDIEISCEVLAMLRNPKK